MIVWVEPYTNSLQDIWDEKSVLRGDGVPETEGRITMALATSPARSSALKKTINRVRFPLSADEWRRVFRMGFQSKEEVQASYPESGWAQFVFDLGHYGRYELEFERALPPVRWVLEDRRDSFWLELRDDTGEDENPEVTYATFEQPDTWVSRPGSEERIGFAPVARGGLYRARTRDRGDMIVVPPNLRRLDSFDSLVMTPKLSARSRRVDALIDLVEATQLWGTARLPGHILARTWRSDVVRLLQSDLFSLVCGPEWQKAERVMRSTRSESALARLQAQTVHSKSDHQTVAPAMIANWNKLNDLPLNERVETFRLLTRHGPEFVGGDWRELVSNHGDEAADWFAEFLLRAASDIHLVTWAGDSLKAALRVLLAWPLAARTARCVVMASLVGSSEEEYPPLFPGWEWSLV